MILYQYTPEALRTWRTSRLGCLYINAYTVVKARGDEGDARVLEIVTQELRRRPFLELQPIYHYLRRQLKCGIQRGIAERTRHKQELLDSFHLEILES